MSSAFHPLADLQRWTTQPVGVIPFRERFNSIFEIGGVGLVGKRGSGEDPLRAKQGRARLDVRSNRFAWATSSGSRSRCSCGPTARAEL